MSEIKLHDFQFKVLKTDSRRIHLLEVQKITQAIETPIESNSYLVEKSLIVNR